MRYAIAPVVGIAIGFSLKATFFPPTAVADVGPLTTIDTYEIQQNSKDIPVHKLHDMSFVFSQPN